MRIVRHLTEPLNPNRWDRSHGTYLAGQAHIAGADETATRMERWWGCGRLRLLVGPELRERFDRQRYLYAQAIQNGDLEAVMRESRRMTAAWEALDRAAKDAKAPTLAPQVWEVTLDNGTVAAIVPDIHHARAVTAQGRALAVYTLDEVGRLLSSFPALVKAKQVWPGAEVERVTRPVIEPLDAIDQPTGLDDLFREGDGDVLDAG